MGVLFRLVVQSMVVLISTFFALGQLNSFETELQVPALASQEGGPSTCRAVFIRAPAIVDVASTVEILAECPLSASSVVQSPEQVNLMSLFFRF